MSARSRQIVAGTIYIDDNGRRVTAIRSVGGGDWIVQSASGLQYAKNAVKLKPNAEGAPDYQFPTITAGVLYLVEDAAMSALTFGKVGGPTATALLVIGTLPPGTTFNTSTGVWDGTPTTEETTGTNLTFRAVGENGLYRDFPVVVRVGDAPTLDYATPTLQEGVLMTPLSPTFTGDGTPVYTVDAGSAIALPTGLALASGTGIISGTPTDDAQDGNLTILVTTEYGTATKVIPITIAAP